MKRLFFAIAALALSACATPYQDMAYRGGVKVTRIDAHTFGVTSRVNEYTSGERVALYLIRKAAEETLASGDDWFMLKGAQDVSSRGTVVNHGSSTTYANASVYGTGYAAHASGTARTFTSPTTISEYVKPGVMAVFKTGKGEAPEGAKDAREVLSFVVPQTE